MGPMDCYRDSFNSLCADGVRTLQEKYGRASMNCYEDRFIILM
jgi:hypothetical protein